MLKRLKIFSLLIVAVSVMSGCALTMPVNATSNPVGKKVGVAEATGYLGVLFFNQDASIKKAAENGGITRISTVDVKTSNILFLVVTYETTVTGE